MSKNTSSANTLFHFTKSIETITSILTNGFYPRYCMEEFEYIDKVREKEFSIPMVCFCDIPLSEIKGHAEKYGENAIGMSKDWGKLEGINPVLYTTKQSLSTKLLNDITNELFKHALNSGVAYPYMVEFMAVYMKPYEGNRWNGRTNEFDGEFTRFYDEREWRYVPKLMGDSWLYKKDFLVEDMRNKFNDRMAKQSKLKFTPNDINYIIVESDDKVLEMANEIMRIGENTYTPDELTELTTKILSMERVLEDF